MVRRSVWFSASIIFLLTAFSLGAGSSQAQTSGDAKRGLSLAESWCTACHVIDQKETVQKVNSPPPFTNIANDPRKTPEYLRGWLTSSHPQMPNFNLGRREIEDLIASLQTLSNSK